MISYNDARKVIEHEAESRRASYPVERLAVTDCANRYSASDVVARDRNPRFDNSAMDGFALRASDSSDASPQNPVRLPVSGRLAAGETFCNSRKVTPSCLEIMTGSMLPAGVDSVVCVENVTVENDSLGNAQAITLRASVSPGENTRSAGEDFDIGDMLFPKGTCILPQHVMALVMGGYTELEVYKRPRVAVVSTGSELVAATSSELLDHQIRNSTAPLLCAALAMYGTDVRYYGTAPDNREVLKRVLLEACEERPDIIITTGGVSVGRFDLVKEVLSELRVRIYFHKAAVRPGKPILFGEFPGGLNAGAPVIFGLPGNPMAVAVGLRFFVRPYLRALFGEKPEVAELRPLTEAAPKPAGLSFFQRGIRNGPGVRILPGQASFAVASFLNAEGWVLGPAASDLLRQGDLVEWYTLW